MEAKGKDKNILKKLEGLGIDLNSDLGKMLVKLDLVYEEIEGLEEELIKLMDRRQELREDAEVMELLIMKQSNKNDRILDKWG